VNHRHLQNYFAQKTGNEKSKGIWKQLFRNEFDW